ncbi:unnamed protein product [Ixodes pacificus]
MASKPILYSFHLSSCAWRVRIGKFNETTELPQSKSKLQDFYPWYKQKWFDLSSFFVATCVVRKRFVFFAVLALKNVDYEYKTVKLMTPAGGDQVYWGC